MLPSKKIWIIRWISLVMFTDFFGVSENRAYQTDARFSIGSMMITIGFGVDRPIHRSPPKMAKDEIQSIQVFPQSDQM